MEGRGLGSFRIDKQGLLEAAVSIAGEVEVATGRECQEDLRVVCQRDPGRRVRHADRSADGLCSRKGPCLG